MTTAWHSPSQPASSPRVLGAAGQVTLETAVRRYLDPGDPASAYLGIVHRLDRPTSGVIIWAKTDKAARRLSIQFQSGGSSRNTGRSSSRPPHQTASTMTSSTESPAGR